MKRRNPQRARVAVILAIGVSVSLILAFFWTASPYTPEASDANAERMFAALGAVIAALAVWLGGNDDDRRDPPDPLPDSEERGEE